MSPERVPLNLDLGEVADLRLCGPCRRPRGFEVVLVVGGPTPRPHRRENGLVSGLEAGRDPGLAGRSSRPSLRVGRPLRTVTSSLHTQVKKNRAGGR